MKLQDINPYIRAAMIQPAVLEGGCLRCAYDHRLFYILEGSGIMLTGSVTLELVPDTLILFRPGFGYYFKGKMRVIVLNFDMTRSASNRRKPKFPPPEAEFDRSQLFDTEAAEGFETLFIKRDGGYFRDVLLEMVSAYHPDDPLADAVTSGMLKKLLAELAGSTLPKTDAVSTLCMQVKQYIRLYTPQIGCNDDIGKHFGYHPVYLAALFKEKTGESLHHAVISERIRQAKQWLTHTDCTIDEIATGVGFATRSHFCTKFREVTGMTPSEYRRGHG